MKSYCDLIKENIINFEKVLLEQYYQLGLDETECIVLLRLYQYKKKGNDSLNLKEIVKKLSISMDRLSEIIISLVNRDFIALSMESDGENKYSEIFSLDGAYRQLGYIFEGKDSKEEVNQTTIEMKKVVVLLERDLKKILSPIELTIIKKWFYDYKYPVDLINEVIQLVLKKKNASVSMIDRMLFSRSKDDVDPDEAAKAQEIFNRRFGKRNG